MPENTSPDFHELLSHLTPEEREQLALELSQDIQHPEETGDVADLAKAIEAHLSQNPEAAVNGLPQDQQTAVDTVKSAEYIEGFLYQAMDEGVTIKQAIDMYDSSLTKTLQNLKLAKLKGNQYKLDVDGDGKIEASDLKKLRHESKESPKHERAESAAEEKGEHMEEKSAAYYQGLFSRAAEYGLSKEAAAPLIKQARGGFVPKGGFNLKDFLAPVAAKIPALDSENPNIGGSSFSNPYYVPSPRGGEVSLPEPDYSGVGKDSLDLTNPRLAGIREMLSQGSGDFDKSPEMQEARLVESLSPTHGVVADTEPGLLEKIKALGSRGLASAQDLGHRGIDAANEYLAAHPDFAKAAPWIAGGLGAAGLGYGAYKAFGGNKKNEEDGLTPKAAAAYSRGFLKRANAFPGSETVQEQINQSEPLQNILGPNYADFKEQQDYNAMLEQYAQHNAAANPGLLEKIKALGSRGLASAQDLGHRGIDAANEYLAAHPDFAKAAPWIAGGLGAAGLGYGAYKAFGGNKKNEKTAAYHYGFLKRASEYGLSERQAYELLQRYSS